MEFESEEPIGGSSPLSGRTASARRARRPGPELVEVFELAAVLGRRTHEVSKGSCRDDPGFQPPVRVPVIVMDEPIFAMEDQQKQRVMDYLAARARREGSPSTTRSRAGYLEEVFRLHPAVLQDGRARLGKTAEIFTRETIEQAYEVALRHAEKARGAVPQVPGGAAAVRPPQ